MGERRGGGQMSGGSMGPPPGGMNGGSMGPSQMGGQQGPDRQQREAILVKAAAKLGISADRLRQALGPPPPDFAWAAQQLGISEQALQEAMHEAGAPQGPPP